MSEELIFNIRATATGMAAGVNEAVGKLGSVGQAYTDLGKKAKSTQDDLSKTVNATDKVSASAKGATSSVSGFGGAATAATPQLKDFGAAADDAKGATEGFGKSQEGTNQGLATTVAVAAAAAVAFRTMVGAIQSGIAAYVQSQAALKGLKAVADHTNTSLSSLLKTGADLSSDGLISPSDVASAQKNLLIYGFTADQAADMLERLKDVAVDNRQANYNLGEAVKVTTEGIRMENSILSDAAGVTKNIAKMYLEYADSIGKSRDELTQAEKVQAVYLGTMTETEPFVGRASQYSKEFGGAQSVLAAETLKANIAFGEATSGALLPFIQAISGGAKALTSFINSNKVLVGVFSVIATGAVGLIVLLGAKAAAIKLLGIVSGGTAVNVTTLSAALKGLWVNAGPAGWIILGITAVATAIAFVSAASAEAKRKAEELRQEIASMSEETAGIQSLITEYRSLGKSAEDTKRIDDIRAELVEKYGLSVAEVDKEGRLLAGNLATVEKELAAKKEMLLMDMNKAKGNEVTAYTDALNAQQEAEEKLAKTEKEWADATTYNLGAQNAAYELASKGGDPETVLKRNVAEIDLGYDVKISEQKLKMAEAEKGLSKLASNMVDRLVLSYEAQGQKVPEAIRVNLFDKITEAFKNHEEFNATDKMGDNFLASFLRINDGLRDSKIEEIQTFKQELIAALMETDTSSEDTVSIIQPILDSITSDEALQQAMDKSQELRDKIIAGIATPAESNQFDQLQQSILDGIAPAQDKINTLMAKGVPGANALSEAVQKLGSAHKSSAAQIKQASIEEKYADATMKDAISTVKSASSAISSAINEVKDVSYLKGAVKALEDYASATDQSGKAAEEAKAAKEYLAKQYGVEADAIDGLLPAISDDIAAKEQLAIANYSLAKASAQMSIVTINDMRAAGKVTVEQANSMIAALNGVINSMDTLAGKSVKTKVPKFNGQTMQMEYVDVEINSVTPPPPKSGGGSGGGSAPAATKEQEKKNDALERELALLEHLKTMDQLTTAEEIANLERILATYAQTEEEKQSISEKIYALKKQQLSEDLEYRKAMGKLTLREEIKLLDQQIALLKEGTAARKELEQRRYEAAQTLERQEYDLKVYYGKLTLDQQIATIKKMINEHKKGTQARIDLEKELYQLQQTQKEKEADQLDRLAQGVISALEAKYEAARKAEDDRLQASADAWQKWGDDQVKAIRDQISALDEMTAQEDRAETERKKRREIAMLEQQLLYEKDDYNRKKLMEQIDQKKTDLDSWMKKNERDDLKKALEGTIDQINEKVDAEKDAIEKQKAANDAAYAERLKAQNLQAEAEKLILNGNQQDILKLLQEYAPDYNATGKSLGEKLVDGFKKAVNKGNIDQWFSTFNKNFEKWQTNVNKIAATAAANFNSQQSAAAATSVTNSPTNNITLNFNGTNATPSAITKELNKLLTQLAKK